MTLYENYSYKNAYDVLLPLAGDTINSPKNRKNLRTNNDYNFIHFVSIDSLQFIHSITAIYSLNFNFKTIIAIIIIIGSRILGHKKKSLTKLKLDSPSDANLTPDLQERNQKLWIATKCFFPLNIRKKISLTMAKRKSVSGNKLNIFDESNSFETTKWCQMYWVSDRTDW